MTSPLVALAVLLATAFATGPETDNLIAPDLEPGGTFFDDDGSTHEGYIEALAAIGVLRGCNPPLSDFTCPADPITRGQMAALLRRSLRLPPASGDAFDDDDGSTFEEDINRVATAGITRGCDAAHPRLFCPDEFVTRGQMAAFLNRGFDLPPSKVDRFSDDDRSTFEKDIDRVASAGITEGCDPDYPRRFCPLEL
ncbi:MAG TPA: S-layer homology domain-containing protein, partial [Acidimicrobiia bacterium]|nr:S-layer homology domain-containing protein [Acidimicrobiia bacterium]